MQHIAEVKNRLMRKIDELEIEKDKFRSLRLETLEGTFEDIIVGDCELSPERRRAYPFERQELANSVTSASIEISFDDMVCSFNFFA